MCFAPTNAGSGVFTGVTFCISPAGIGTLVKPNVRSMCWAMLKAVKKSFMLGVSSLAKAA